MSVSLGVTLTHSSSAPICCWVPVLSSSCWPSQWAAVPLVGGAELVSWWSVGHHFVCFFIPLIAERYGCFFNHGSLFVILFPYYCVCLVIKCCVLLLFLFTFAVFISFSVCCCGCLFLFLGFYCFGLFISLFVSVISLFAAVCLPNYLASIFVSVCMLLTDFCLERIAFTG